MKKKIFFIMSTDDYSGAEIVNFNIIEQLKDNYDFYWVSRKGNINKALEQKNINWIEIEALTVKEIKRIVKTNRPDILHATDFRASVICALANTHTPLIEHLHNNAPWLKKISINSLAFLCAGLKAEKILTVSSSIEKEYIFSKFLKNKFLYIGNPVNNENILTNVKNINITKEYDICCVARITEAKDPIRFLNIINEIKKKKPALKVVWVGDGELRSEMESKIKELNLEKNIDLVGFQKNPYIYMLKSKIFMLTSKWEGFGLAVYEALTLGLPCIVSNVGGLPDIVNNECGKLCNKNEEFIHFIEILLENNSEYLKYKKNAQKRSVKLNNRTQYFSTIDSIYSSLKENKL